MQFHPKYSYQDFIGGYVVRGANVSYENGILLDLIKTCADNKEKHLLIIDETTIFLLDSFADPHRNGIETKFLSD